MGDGIDPVLEALPGYEVGVCSTFQGKVFCSIREKLCFPGLERVQRLRLSLAK